MLVVLVLAFAAIWGLAVSTQWDDVEAANVLLALVSVAFVILVLQLPPRLPPEPSGVPIPWARHIH